jgi:hypothetical protein
MKKPILLAATLAFTATLVQSANKPQQTGTIVAENSVPCGAKQDKKKESVDLLCQEYVVRTDTTDYRIRQEKPAAKALIALNTPVEFTLDKDKIKFKANGKSFEYIVVSESLIPTTTAAAPKP